MSRKKGNRTKRKAQKFYETQGWLVDDCEKAGRFVTDKDLFNLFDLVAIKDGVVKFIQVKTNQPAPQNTYREWVEEYGNANIKAEVYTHYDYKGPRIQTYESDGRIVELDLRTTSNDGEKLWKEHLDAEQFRRLRKITERPQGA